MDITHCVKYTSQSMYSISAKNSIEYHSNKQLDRMIPSGSTRRV